MKSNYFDTLLFLFFSHYIKLKIMHFQTDIFSVHKATDKYIKKFLSNMDKFFEIAQGRYGKMNVGDVQIYVPIINIEIINNEINFFCDTLTKFDKYLENNSDLLNIRDELLSDANQLRYLLTLK